MSRSHILLSSLLLFVVLVLASPALLSAAPPAPAGAPAPSPTRWMCTSAPGAPRLLSPRDAVIPGPQALLRWAQANCGVRYEVQVQQAHANGATVEVAKNLTGLEYTTRHLAPGAYRWRVRACNNSGCSAWTGQGKFFLVPASSRR